MQSPYQHSLVQWHARGCWASNRESGVAVVAMGKCAARKWGIRQHPQPRVLRAKDRGGPLVTGVIEQQISD